MASKIDRSWKSLKVIRVIHNRAVKDFYKGHANLDRKSSKKSFIANLLKIETEDSMIKSLVKMCIFVFYIRASASDAVSSMPVSWTVKRINPIRQMSVIYVTSVERYGKKVNDYHDINIPHFYGSPNRLKGVKYTKGSHYGGLILKDGSKLIVWAKNEQEAKKVINHYKQYVSPKMIKDPPVFQPSKGRSIKEGVMIPVRGDFYENGLEQLSPNTRISLR